MRILLVPRPVSYGVVNYFLRDLGLEWEQLGHEVSAQLDQPPDWIVSVNAASLACPRDPRLAGASRLELMVDDPIAHYILYFYPQLRFRVALVDRDFCDVIGGLRGWSQAPLFCPHAALLTPLQEGPRPIDLLFLGTNYPLDALYTKLRSLLAAPEIPAHWHGWIEGMMEERSAEPICRQLSLEDWERLWQDPSLAVALQQLDRYLRIRRRHDWLKRLGEAGLIVDLYGDNWSLSPIAHLHRVHPSVPFQSALQLMGEAKIVLNFQPNFGYALHERMLSAMAAGALVVTDGNRLICEEFRAGEELLLFGDDLPDRIRSLLEDEGQRERMAAAGRAKVLARHTWAHRARQIHEQLFS